MTSKTFALGLVLVAGCLKANPNYEAGGDGGGSDAGSGSGSGSNMSPQCTSNTMCGSDTPVCDQGSGSAFDTCRACAIDSECGGNACLPGGACGDDTTVAYLDPAAGSGSDCTAVGPCQTVAAADATGRPYIRLIGTLSEQVVDTDHDVTFLGDPTAKLSYGTGTLVELTAHHTGFYNVEMTGSIGDGVEVSGSAAVTFEACNIHGNVGAGIVAAGTPTSMVGVTIDRTKVESNMGGGINLSYSTYTITNTFIDSNCQAGSTLGGISISNSPSGTLSFSTIAFNNSAVTGVAGVNCGAGTAALEDVIVYTNTTNYVGCSFDYSDVEGLGSAGTNLSESPSFQLGSGGYHLTADSPLKDMADPTAMIPFDIDGDTRPQGARRDIGADEIKQ